MKALWLASWYPNRHDAFEGDFIQRHARAAALRNDVMVIYINQSAANTKMELETETNGRLTEMRIYLPAGAKTSFFERISKQKQYRKAYKDAIQKYIDVAGLPDLVHVHIPMRAGIAGLWAKKKYGLPMIVSEHWGIYGNTLHDDIRRKSFSFRLVLKRIIEKADKLVTVSSYLGGTINSAGITKPFHVIPNCVDTYLFNAKERGHTSKFRFLHVSNLMAVKNPQLMLDAIRLFTAKGNEAEFVFIGNTDDSWQKKAFEMGLGGHVIFKGLMPHEKVADEMMMADALFLYSDFETFSCVTAEALCSGLPVISANTGAAPELLNDKNGILTEPGNANALSEAFAAMQRMSGSFNRQAIADAASASYSIERIAHLFDELYRSVKK
jgi:glycosyltransferase involved in cell wall biosynthesis